MKIHFMGIGGSGMSGVASLASKIGYEVTGCDLEKQTAYGGGIFQGHSPNHLDGIDLLVVTPAVYYQKEKSAELLEGEKRNIVITWEKFVEEYLSQGKKMICIAGTHGKSTTTAMVGKLLDDAGLDPMVVIGANVSWWGGSSRFGKGKYAVIEADEFNNNFLNYSPEIIILNNIEFDHPDFFKDERAVFESFKKFIDRLTGMKVLIVNRDSTGVQKLLGIMDKSDLEIIEYSPNDDKLNFSLSVPGKHNIANALGVNALGKFLDINERIINKSLSSFSGIGRRLELIANKNGVKVYDDYAHHPTAIKTTLEGVREKYPDAKILVIDEPHGYKRTKALLAEYKGVFDSADKVIVGPIFKARDEVDVSITPELIAKTSGHKNVIGLNSFEEIVVNCKSEIENSDYEVIVVMGAGKSYLWAREIAKLIGSNKLIPEKGKKFSNMTTFHVGGEVGEYLSIKNKDDVSVAVSLAKSTKHKIFILGDGSDILASDTNFNDFVLKYTSSGFQIDGNCITADAGMKWDDLVKISVENNLQGLECLSGIPGTVGAAPVQNIGAYGSELKNTFVSLEAYNIEEEKFETFSKEKCQFGYRESIFKQKSHWQKYIIVSVTFKLKKNGKPSVSYESLKIKPNPTLAEVRSAVLETRKNKLEDPKEHGNAGSFFKNPIISLVQKNKLEKGFPNAKFFPFDDRFKISAAWLIEKAGWKGKIYRGAGVSPKHALILINATGKARARDILELSEMIIKDIYKKFEIKLEREVQLINF